MLVVIAVGNSREGAGNQLLPSICGRERKLPCKACPTLLLQSVSGTHRVARGCGLQQAARRSDGELLASTTWRRVLAVLLVTLGPFPFSADAAA